MTNVLALDPRGLLAWEKDFPRHFEALERAQSHTHLRRFIAALEEHQAEYAGKDPDLCESYEA